MRLSGRVALITAVGDLAGDALVRGLAGEGARVAANHIKPEVAERSAALAREAGSEGLAVSAHLLDREPCDAAADGVVERSAGSISLSRTPHGSSPTTRWQAATPAADRGTATCARRCTRSKPCCRT